MNTEVELNSLIQVRSRKYETRFLDDKLQDVQCTILRSYAIVICSATYSLRQSSLLVKNNVAYFQLSQSILMPAKQTIPSIGQDLK